MNLKATIAIALLGIAVLAGAQETKPLGLSARIGPFFPLHSYAQTAGNTWLGAGLDFKIHDIETTDMGSVSVGVSLDYSYRQDFRQVPLLANLVCRRGPMYYLAGVGINFTRQPDGTGFTSESKFAYDLGIGYDILKNGGTPVFLESRFFGNQESTFNGFGVYVGVRL